ncbi:MAG: hypothetical protein QM760_18900 [Nibricoccus sp.]
MKNEMSRREFLGTIVPVAGHARTLAGYRQQALRIAKWTLLAACVWLCWQMLSGIPFEGWLGLGWLFLKFVVPVTLGAWLLGRLQEWIDGSGNAWLQGIARGVGRVAVLVSMIACGAVIYEFWQRKPADAICAMIALALFEFRRGFSDQPANAKEKSASS